MILGLALELVSIDQLGEWERDPAALNTRFSEHELSYCLAKRSAGEYLAARLAAKQATLKVLDLNPSDESLLRQVEVRREPGGRPSLHLGVHLSDHSLRLGAPKLHLSLSHSGGIAVALVIAEGRTPHITPETAGD